MTDSARNTDTGRKTGGISPYQIPPTGKKETLRECITGIDVISKALGAATIAGATSRTPRTVTTKIRERVCFHVASTIVALISNATFEIAVKLGIDVQHLH